uniref:Uncharacterized protein n=1 Tax=Candidatus Kentrum sp. MB TaxID=2138164 RepID=A0A450X1T2_9GAMM|nr:MAG: hypothetical protein BECKMB1821G_GA0114241_100440 [Candidatus Kentron sp. MB]
MSDENTWGKMCIILVHPGDAYLKPHESYAVGFIRQVEIRNLSSEIDTGTRMFGCDSKEQWWLDSKFQVALPQRGFVT